MSKFIFYTSEGFTQDPQGNDIENCQMLGTACGDNMQEAMTSLLADNVWIEERGYDLNAVLAVEIADK